MPRKIAAPPPKEGGFYWIRLKHGLWPPEVAKRQEGQWMLTGHDEPFQDSEVEVQGRELDPPKI
jgi:hypothetical protein